MQVNYQTIHLKKRFPLAISRGTYSGSENLFISIVKDNICGIGEMSPGASEGAESALQGQRELEEFLENDFHQSTIEQIYMDARAHGVAACALAALDIALWDRQAKAANSPLYSHLGFPLPSVATSVTIGINLPNIVEHRIPLLLEGTGVKSLKIKLGSAQGIEADKAMYSQVLESSKPYSIQLRVDANGGWNTNDALHMMKWLADRGCDYIEQPIKEGAEDDLAYLFRNRPLPIFIDESCRFAEDVGRWSDCVDGVNIKLMKCGGVTGALQIMNEAKKHKLKTMIGCMGESSLSISAAAALSGAIDHIDLDSQLNLAPDPCTGAALIDGVVVPNNEPGHGAKLKPEFCQQQRN